MRIMIWLIVFIASTALTLGGAPSCKKNDNPITSPVQDVKQHSLIDSTYLDSLVSAIRNNVYGQVRSVLIHRGDDLVFEHYFNGYHREYRQAVYSVTKSITSTLIGIAVDRGDISDVSVRILPYFSYYPFIANLDVSKESITLENLLTMTAGLEWDELSIPYTRPDNPVNLMYGSTDWVKYVLDLPMAVSPGVQFAYNSGVSMLLSAILTHATGLSARDYASVHLFDRLGITTWSWEEAPNNPGMSIGGWGVRMRPLDMVTFGRLYLERGMWGGERIISEAWVEASTTHHATINDQLEYGYQWWMYSDWIVNEGIVDVNDIFIAIGRGGQYIWVVPQYELVAVSTAWNDNNGKSSSPMFFRYIIPAVQAVESKQNEPAGDTDLKAQIN